MTERYCPFCDPAKRDIEVDVAVALGVESYRELGAKLQLSKDSLCGHVGHIRWNSELRAAAAKYIDRTPKSLTSRALMMNQLEGEESPTPEQVIHRTMFLEQMAISVLMEAEKRGDPRQINDSLQRAESITKLVAQITGNLNAHQGSTVLVLSNSPEFLQFQSRVVGALSAYPEAQLAVSRALTSGGVVDAEVVE